MDRLISRGLIDFVGPSVNDGIAVGLLDGVEDSLAQFRFGRDANWRSTERAIFEKNPSMRLSHEPCLGVNTKVKRPSGCLASQALVSLDIWAEWLSRMSLIAVAVG